MQDVARAAGVSAMTVSRVVNGGNNVRQSTREAVLAAIDRLQYRPNSAARLLAAGGSDRLGLLYANPSDAYLSQLLVGALEAARRAGTHLVLESCEAEDPGAELEATRQLIEADVRGVILPPPMSESPTVRAELAAAGIPVAMIAMGLPMAETCNVRIDDFAAAVAMTQHLLDLGHRDIAFIHGHPNQVASRERHRGFVHAVTEAGIDPSLLPIETGYFSFRSGMLAAERILSRATLPTAIFASNDDMAAAAVGVAHRRGLHVPEDISIVGFDDTSPATTIWPELTTVRQPIAQMAEVAVEMLVQRLRARAPAEPGCSDERVLDYQLVIRESSGPRPERD